MIDLNTITIINYLDVIDDAEVKNFCVFVSLIVLTTPIVSKTAAITPSKLLTTTLELSLAVLVDKTTAVINCLVAADFDDVDEVELRQMLAVISDSVSYHKSVNSIFYSQLIPRFRYWPELLNVLETTDY